MASFRLAGMTLAVVALGAAALGAGALGSGALAGPVYGANRAVNQVAATRVAVKFAGIDRNGLPVKLPDVSLVETTGGYTYQGYGIPPRPSGCRRAAT